MSITVTPKDDNTFIVELQEPEQSWLQDIVQQFHCDATTAFSVLVGCGFVDIISRFVPKPSKENLEQLSS